MVERPERSAGHVLVSLPSLAEFYHPQTCSPTAKLQLFRSHLTRLPGGSTCRPQSGDVGTCSRAYTGPKVGWGESLHGGVWTVGLKTLFLGPSPRWRQRARDRGQGWGGPSLSKGRGG